MPKININGVTREMTDEEIIEMERLQAEMPPHEATPEERIAELERIIGTLLATEEDYKAALAEFGVSL